jgi:hypothetical protein
MKKVRILLLLTALVSPYAHAYIDPGSGSFLVQMAIASLIGAGFTIKMYYRNLKEKISTFFSGKKAEPTDKEPTKES